MSGLHSRLCCHWNQPRVFFLNVNPTQVGPHYLVRRFPLLSGSEIRPLSRYPHRCEEAAMNKTLSLDEEREFWAELFALAVRGEARKRAALEVRLELLEDVRQTESNQI